jgi:hypothetical protein
MKYLPDALLELVLTSLVIAYYLSRNRERSIRAAYTLHFLIAVSGLVLFLGTAFVDWFKVENELILGMGEILGYWFAFSLIFGAPVLVLASMMYWRTWGITMPTLLLVIQLSVMFLYEEKTTLLTGMFILYAIVALRASLRWYFSWCKPGPGKESE